MVEHSRNAVSKIFPEQSVIAFQEAVRQEVLSELEGLDPTAVLTIKSLIQAGLNEKNNMDAVNLREGYGMCGERND